VKAALKGKAGCQKGSATAQRSARNLLHPTTQHWRQSSCYKRGKDPDCIACRRRCVWVESMRWERIVSRLSESKGSSAPYGSTVNCTSLYYHRTHRLPKSKGAWITCIVARAEHALEGIGTTAQGRLRLQRRGKAIEYYRPCFGPRCAQPVYENSQQGYHAAQKSSSTTVIRESTDDALANKRSPASGRNFLDVLR
jgi:hypothetical protein